MGSYFCASEVEQMFVETLKARVSQPIQMGVLSYSFYPFILALQGD